MKHAEEHGSDGHFVNFLARHFVALAVEYESLNRDGSVFHHDFTVLSGFVVAIDEKWYWITAGHAFKRDLNKPIAEGILRVIGGGFLDHFGHEATHASMIPFRYEPEVASWIEDDSLGIDLGMIPVPPLIRRNLEANRVTPIERFNWEQQHRLQFVSYRMLGIPAKRASSRMRDDGTADLSVQIGLLGIERLDCSSIRDVSSQHWFCGRVHHDEETLKGTSGGPIFGFRQDDEGRWSYHVVAIQCIWRPETDIIFGCSVPHFFRCIADYVNM